MVLPEKIIDELSKSPSAVVGWSWRIFMFSLFILITTVVFYFGLAYGFKSYLNSKVNNLKEEEVKIRQSISPQDEKNLILFYSQIYNIKKILDNRVSLSNFLIWLSKNIHPDIVLTTLSFDINNNQIGLGGVSKQRKSALEQALIFQRNENLESVTLNNLRGVVLDKEIQWQFNLVLKLKKSADFIEK